MVSSTTRKTAAITGAAGGLGGCFARQLAGQGYDLLLIDRQAEPVERLCAELAEQHGVDAEPCVADLTDRESIGSLARRLGEVPDLDLLINNAGFGFSRYLVDVEVERHVDMISVHVVAPMSLTHAVLPGMIRRNRGTIVNVSSLNAWSPSAGVVQYAATKAYVTCFSAAVADEVAGTKVCIQTLCPGFTHTGFHSSDTMRGFDYRRAPKWMWMTPDAVVACSLRHLHRRSGLVIPGWQNRMFAFFMRRPMFEPLVRRFCRLDPVGRESLAAAAAECELGPGPAVVQSVE